MHPVRASTPTCWRASTPTCWRELTWSFFCANLHLLVAGESLELVLKRGQPVRDSATGMRLFADLRWGEAGVDAEALVLPTQLLRTIANYMTVEMIPNLFDSFTNWLSGRLAALHTHGESTRSQQLGLKVLRTSYDVFCCTVNAVAFEMDVLQSLFTRSAEFWDKQASAWSAPYKELKCGAHARAAAAAAAALALLTLPPLRSSRSPHRLIGRAQATRCCT